MGKVTTRQLTAARMLCAYGCMPSGAAAVVGNCSEESGGPNLPSAFRRSSLDHGSQGLCQWRLGRLTEYMAGVKAQHPDADEAELWDQYGRLDYQVAFIVKELRRDYPALWGKLVAGGPVAALTADFTWSFERPSKQYAHLDVRIAYAQEVYAACNPKAGVVHVSNAIDMAAAPHDQAANGAAGLAGLGLLAVTGTGALHVAPHLNVLEVSSIGIGIAVLIAGVVGFATSATKAALTRSAKIGLDTSLPPKVIVDTPRVSKIVPGSERVDPQPAKVKVDVKDEEAKATAALLGGKAAFAQVQATANAPSAATLVPEPEKRAEPRHLAMQGEATTLTVKQQEPA